MSAREFVVIANPHAGRGRAERVLERAVAALRAGGAQARGELTTSIGHATELAEGAASGGAVAVAVGGDGLLRAVAKGCSRHGGTLGIVPAGRGNDFARTVGIDKKAVDENIARLLNAEPVATDCIAVVGGAPGSRPGTGKRPDEAHSEPESTAPGSRPGTGTRPDEAHSERESTARGRAVPTARDGIEDVALGNVYAGFDSLSNIHANDLRFNLGGLSYTWAALRVALTMPVLDLEVTVDGATHTYRGSGVAIGNSRFYGGNVPFAPEADVHDGLLDIVMFEQTDARSRVTTLWSMRSGAHLGRDGVLHVRGREIQVRVTPALEAYSDGDPVAQTPLTATVMPGAIKLLRP